MRSWRSTVIAVVAGLVVAAGIAAVEVADRVHKQSVMNRLEVAEWYCENVGERCGGGSSTRIEDRWNARQAVYEYAIGATLSLTALVGARGTMLRRRRGRTADMASTRTGETERA